MRKPRDFDFALVRSIVIVGAVLFAWAAVQIWVLDAPQFGLATAIGTLVGCVVAYLFGRWMKKKSEPPR